MIAEYQAPASSPASGTQGVTPDGYARNSGIAAGPVASSAEDGLRRSGRATGAVPQRRAGSHPGRGALGQETPAGLVHNIRVDPRRARYVSRPICCKRFTLCRTSGYRYNALRRSMATIPEDKAVTLAQAGTSSSIRR